MTNVLETGISAIICLSPIDNKGGIRFGAVLVILHRAYFSSTALVFGTVVVLGRAWPHIVGWITAFTAVFGTVVLLGRAWPHIVGGEKWIGIPAKINHCTFRPDNSGEAKSA